MNNLRFFILLISFLIITCIFYLYELFPLKYIDLIPNSSFDKLLILSIIKVESSFKTNAISNVGAYGLMQVLPSTAEWINNKFNTNYNLKVPKDNILLGITYLEYLYNITKDLQKTISYYNTGPNASDEIVKTAGLNYYNKIMKAYSLYKFLYRSDNYEISNK
ncbi:lytic transglycosylase domain-containing protein [Thermosipho africanus]|uniref:lytic transglycosylase domain-containing protein n=1 Tax=Thermosipho africanus TaxID=2421 RepID=UPI001E6003B2|nr:lytic transglycosylase domain-containing protein [Thermosipho africanus]